MKILLFALPLLTALAAQPLPVVPMQMDPDLLALSLRERKPLMPMADCNALDLWECHPDEPARVMDLSLRWVQLDDDAQLEAILTAEAKAEDSYAAYIFDKQSAWNLVGSFFCRQSRCHFNNLIRVEKLTMDSPPLLLVYRDLGGSGSSILTTEAFQLRGGKLWPVIQITNREEVFLGPESYTRRQRVLNSTDRLRLVIHTIREEPPGHAAQNQCEVLQWDAASFTFAPSEADQPAYCDPKTGMPVTENTFLFAGLPNP